MASPNNGPCVRVIIQQCVSARLQVQPAPSDEQEAQYVEIKRGVVLYLCFLKGSTMDLIPKVVKSVLNVKLSESSEKMVSILDLPGDVLIVPQATLGGKIKGKSMQYHSNIGKDEALMLYQEFLSLCNKMVMTDSKVALGDEAVPQVKYGTYGNRQVLSVVTNGPYTHVLDF